MITETDLMVSIIVQNCIAIDLSDLKSKYKLATHQHSIYEAIGIIDGNKYLNKVALQKALIDRSKKIIELVEIVHSTQPVINLYSGIDLNKLGI